jgi:uncharacterized protein YjbI with pentapeptide repeats
MPPCQGRLSNGESCPKIVEEGQTLCRWHDPEDESWREIYEQLETATPGEKADIVLWLIEEHPDHRLILPDRGDFYADLQGINLNRETLEKRGEQSGNEKPIWWDASHQGANLQYANLQGADLEYANLQGAFLIGANLQDAILRLANLEDVEFFRANLQGVDFTEGKLQGAHLWHANLQDAVLTDANLQDASLTNSDLEGADLEYANLQGAHLWHANLQGAFLTGANLQRADLMEANLQGAYLMDANLQGARLTEAELQGVDLFKVDNLTNVYISDAWLDKTRLRREQLGEAIGEEIDEDFSAAKRGYLALKQNYDDLGDYDASSWAYRKERRMEKLEARQKGREALNMHNWNEAFARYFKFFSDWLVEWLCDYGESVWRVIGWMAVLLFVGGPLLFSAMGGFVWSYDLYNGYFALPSPWLRFWYNYRLHLIYTLDALTTASFSGLQPSNDAVKIASGLFAIAGIVLAGLLGFVAGNRIRRS